MWKQLNHRHVLPDLLLTALSLYLSLFIRLSPDDFVRYLPIMNRYLPFFIILQLGSFYFLGVYDIIWRYISFRDATKFAKAVALASLLIVATTYILDIGRLPRSTFFINALLVTLLLGGIRILRRVRFESELRKTEETTARRVLIFGAGTLGSSIARRLTTLESMRYNIVGFVDDDPRKFGRSVNGIKVLGNRHDLPQLLGNNRAQELVIAVSQLPGEILGNILQTARLANVRTRLLTSIVGRPHEKNNMDIFRNVELADLLNRPQKKIDLASIERQIQGKCILVTGAGGSIGSELCRQILNMNPSKLVLLDHSEFNLYQIDHELRVTSQGLGAVVPVLADIKDRKALSCLMAKHRPDLVFHAAAYKHVHLVEKNPHTSVLNNILGTRTLLNACEEAKVGVFVLISSDKAVNPVGVMGGTKRICELMVEEAGRRTGKQYCAVRFGNVLGSSGSLIPLLKRQIENGEPVTITHPDIKRFFMLIPEAVSLVLKAASISSSGDIMLLKMGDPIRIVDIATSLIVLMGRSTETVPIVFTGLRPGEKMFEELYLTGNEVSTEVDDILIVRKDPARRPNGYELQSRVDGLIQTAEQGTGDIAAMVHDLIRVYDTQKEAAPTAPEVGRRFINLATTTS